MIKDYDLSIFVSKNVKFSSFSCLNKKSLAFPKDLGSSKSINKNRPNPGEVADDVDIESLGFAHKYDITGGHENFGGRGGKRKRYIRRLRNV